MERHCNAVRSTGEEYTHPEIEMYMFPQIWGSTSLGFGGIGGQAITTAYTVVVNDYHDGWCSVFFGDQLAYVVKNPNQIFYEDVKNGSMKPIAKAGAYRRDDDA